jgi:hypothetical protein
VFTPTNLSAIVADARERYERHDLTGARAVLIEALKVATPTLGAADRDVLQTSRLLATLYREGGELAPARRILEEAIAAGQLRWPEDDPLMLLMIFDLGVVADEFGNRHEARRNFGIVARLGPDVLGPDHAVVVAAAGYLDPESTQVIPAVLDNPSWEAPNHVPETRPTPRAEPARMPAQHRAPGGRRTLVILILIVTAVALAAAAVVTYLR